MEEDLWSLLTESSFFSLELLLLLHPDILNTNSLIWKVTKANSTCCLSPCILLTGVVYKDIVAPELVLVVKGVAAKNTGQPTLPECQHQRYHLEIGELCTVITILIFVRFPEPQHNSAAAVIAQHLHRANHYQWGADTMQWLRQEEIYWYRHRQIYWYR